MGIGINFNNFTSSYGIQNIPVVRPEDIASQSARSNETVAPVAPAAKVEESEVQLNRASRIANLEDVSLTFNKEDSFDNIGADADIESLDMSKAISNMRRDSILSDYQRFVGPTSEQLTAGLDDGLVFIK